MSAVKKVREGYGFEASWRQHLQPGARPAHAYEISWATLKQIQEWDQTSHFGCKRFHKLTPAHFQRTPLTRMNVGIALDIFDEDVNQVLTSQAR